MLRGGVAGAAALLGGSLVGCGKAKPVTAAANPVVLLWHPWTYFTDGGSASAVPLYQEGIKPFLAQNKGVQVTINFPNPSVASLTGGAGPDVMEYWVLNGFVQNNLLLDLTPYISKDGVDLSVFPSNTINFYKEVGTFSPQKAGLYCLPAYIHTLAMAVNLSLLDDAGQPYPEPGWTWEEWASMWQQVTVKNDGSSSRTGAWLYFGGYNYSGTGPAPFYLRGFGGDYVDPTDPTKCYLDQPGSIQALEWIYGLLQSGAVTMTRGFQSGSVVSAAHGSAGSILSLVENMGNVTWSYYETPVWPKGKVAYAADDFYAINAQTKHPDIAWEFLKFLTVENSWQQFMMHLALTGPNKAELWPEWAATAAQVAPTLADKNLQVMVDQVQNNEVYPGSVFRYNDSSAASTINGYLTQIAQGTIEVPVACQTMTQQVNALEQQGAAAAASTSSAAGV